MSAPQLASNKTDDGKLNVGLPSIKSVVEIEEPEGDVDEKTSTEDKGLSDSILGDLSRFKQEHPSLQNISVVTNQTIDDDEGGEYKNNIMPRMLSTKAGQDALSSNLADSDPVLPNKNSDGVGASNDDLAESDTSPSLLSEKKQNRQRRRKRTLPSNKGTDTSVRSRKTMPFL